MPSGQVYELAILLSLKDLASGNLDRFKDKLRATGKEGRATLDTIESLQKNLKRELVIGGVGLAGLTLLKGGVMAAADYEAALLDLRSAYQEVATAGGLSAAEQAAQLNQLEHLAVRLGNRLQGNTGDYIAILASLRKAGVDTKIVLGGAGEAAANLANVSGALLRGEATEQAKQLGQFGKMFKLRPDEFEKSVNLFSALKDRFDVESGSLIESAKYFQATANSLKISGIGGAEETLKFFALLKRQGGLEGSMAGTGARAFFTQIVADKKKIAELKKETGIDLSQMFDVKGEFKGFENALAIMEKFRNLTPARRMEKLSDIFGERGAEVAGVMVESGVEGWKAITAEAAKAVPVNEKINQQMETTRAKLEAIQGSLTNLVATSFTPMLDRVKPLLDMGNDIAGWSQEFAQSHQVIAGVTSELVGLGAISLTIVGGIGAMRTGWQLWRIASTIGASEQGLLTFLNRTAVQANTTAASLGATAAEVRVLKTEMAAASSQMTLPFLMNPRGGPQQGLLPFMYETEKATTRVGMAMEREAVRVGWFKNALGSAKTQAGGLLNQVTNLAAMPAINFAINIAVIAGAAEVVADILKTTKEINDLFEKNKQDAAVTYDILLRSGQLGGKQPVTDTQIDAMLKKLNEKGELTGALREQPNIFTDPEKFLPFMGEKHPILPDEYLRGSFLDIIKPKPYQGRINNLLNMFGPRSPGLFIDDATAIARLEKLIPEAHFPRFMAGIIKSVRAGGLGPEVGEAGKNEFLRLLGKFDPQTFQAANAQLEELSKSSEPVIKDFAELSKSTGSMLTPSIYRASNAFDRFSLKLDFFSPPNFGPFGNNTQPSIETGKPPGLPLNKPSTFDSSGFKRSHASLRSDNRNISNEDLLSLTSAVARNEGRQINISMGGFTIEPTADVEAIVSQVEGKQQEQIAELRQHLADIRRFDRMGARALQIGRERA